jgi:hypothetical protein
MDEDSLQQPPVDEPEDKDPRFKYINDESKTFSAQNWKDYEENIILKEEIVDRLSHRDFNRTIALLRNLTELDLGTRLTFVTGSRLITDKWDKIDEETLVSQLSFL